MQNKNLENKEAWDILNQAAAAAMVSFQDLVHAMSKIQNQFTKEEIKEFEMRFKSFENLENPSEKFLNKPGKQRFNFRNQRKIR